MYLSTHKKKVKDKIYISYSLRTSYRDTKGKVRHKHIANLPKCTDEEIKALRLALTFKGKLEELGTILLTKFLLLPKMAFLKKQ